MRTRLSFTHRNFIFVRNSSWAWSPDPLRKMWVHDHLVPVMISIAVLPDLHHYFRMHDHLVIFMINYQVHLVPLYLCTTVSETNKCRELTDPSHSKHSCPWLWIEWWQNQLTREIWSRQFGDAVYSGKREICSSWASTACYTRTSRQNEWNRC